MATIAAPPVTKTTLDVGLLRDARALYSKNPSHVPDPQVPSVGTFCVLTALREATDYWFPYAEALRRAAGDPDSLVDWNAEHTTEEVLEVWDRAIAALEAEAA